MAAEAGLSPKIRLVVTSGPLPLLTIAAQQCFWDMTLAFLNKLMKYKDMEPPSNTGDPCSTLFSMLKQILDCSDEDVVSILCKRLAINDQKTVFAEELINCDEGIELLRTMTRRR